MTASRRTQEFPYHVEERREYNITTRDPRAHVLSIQAQTIEKSMQTGCAPYPQYAMPRKLSNRTGNQSMGGVDMRMYPLGGR